MFVVACFFVFVCLEFQIIRFVISTFTAIFFIEISFVYSPPPHQHRMTVYMWSRALLRPSNLTMLGGLFY